MPKFLAGCITTKKKLANTLKNKEFWPVQINGNKFATGQILKSGRICEGANFRWLSSKVSRTMKVNYRLFFFRKIICSHANGRAARALRPVAAAPGFRFKKCLPAVGGLRLALPPAGVGMHLCPLPT